MEIDMDEVEVIGTLVVIMALVAIVIGVVGMVNTVSNLNAVCEDVGMERVAIDIDGLTQHVCLDKTTRTFVEINNVNGKFIRATYKD
jgi:hypothetical protein